MALTPEESFIVGRARVITARADSIELMASDAKRMLEEAGRLSVATKTLQADIERLVAEKTVCFPWLADAIAQYQEAADLKVAELLEKKLHPAVGSAAKVRQLAREKREALRKYRLARFRAQYYESLFPWLADYVTEGIDDLVRQDSVRHSPPDEVNDPVDQILSRLPAAEYNQLSSSEKNQRALDHWLLRPKSNWEAGREYEQFVGYRYELNGYEVRYFGATERLEDMGRDIIAKKGSETLIIQCKRWSAQRTIREKHLFQLFGTTVQYSIESVDRDLPAGSLLFEGSTAKSNVKAVFITSSSLSELARKVAKSLNIEVFERLELDRTYPRIKCNVCHQSQAKIYHLPFDQQYDRVVISPQRGEFYASTVAEAEKAGFRRAWRYRASG